MTKKTKKKIKARRKPLPSKETVKAWAVTVFDEFISNCRSEEGYAARAVFFDEREAERFAASFEGDQDPRVIECTIIYSLPKKRA